MFFESLIFMQILITFNQKPANYVKEITTPAAARNV
jgi:hypothetical protein